MDIVPRRVALPIAIAAVVLCGVVAPIQWFEGNTTRALLLGLLAISSLLGLGSVLRRRDAQPAVSVQAKSASKTSPSPAGENPRWHAETLADYLPDPADRRKVLRRFIGAGVLFLAGIVACCIGAGITGDLSFIGFAVLLAVPVLIILYAVMRNRADL